MIQKYFPSKRNPSIELYRLLGSLIVIGVHCIGLIPKKEGHKRTNNFISCIFADGVAIFWFILGFHLFKNKDYCILLQKILKRIYAKYFALGFTFIISNNFFSHKPLLPTINDFKKIIYSVLIFKNPFPYLGVSWYLYTYFLITFLYPVLRQFTKFLEEKSSRKRNFIIITLFLLIINDFMGNNTFMFSHRSINSVFPASIQIIFGNIFYNSCTFQRKKYFILISVIIFFILNIIRTEFLITFSCRNIVFWYSSFGTINALMIFIFSFCIIPYEKCEKSYHYLINYFASNTFGVYLIHNYVKTFLLKQNLGKYIISKTYSKNNYMKFVAIYLTLLISIIFIICSIIVVIFSFIFNLFLKLRIILDILKNIFNFIQ